MTGSILFRSLIFFGMMLAAVCSAAKDSGMSNYHLGAGDTLGIQVYDEKELSVEKARLSDAGTISIPMLGEIKVSGMTVSDLELRVVEGLNNAQTAERLGISEHSVKFHVQNVCKKLGVNSRVAAVVKAIRMGLIVP